MEDILKALEERREELEAAEDNAFHNLGFVQGRIAELNMIYQAVKDGPPETPTDE
jgi:hypothetical protein